MFAPANARSENLQALNVDMGLLPDEKGCSVCNTVWMLDDFTVENGPLRVIPGSHCWGKVPQQVLSDPYATHPQEILVTSRARNSGGDERAPMAGRKLIALIANV